MKKSYCSLKFLKQLFRTKDALKDFKSLLGEGSETKQFTEEEFQLCLKDHEPYYGPIRSGKSLKLVLRDSNEGKNYKKIVLSLSQFYQDAKALFLGEFQDSKALLHLLTQLKMNIRTITFYHCVIDKYFSSFFQVSRFRYLSKIVISSCHFQNKSLKILFKVDCLSLKKMEFQNTDLTSDAHNISKKSPHLKQISFTNHPWFLTNIYIKNYYQLFRLYHIPTFSFRSTWHYDYIYLNYLAKLEMHQGIPTQIFIFHKMEVLQHLWEQNLIPPKLLSSLRKMIDFISN